MATWNIQGLRTKQLEVFKELEKQKVDICVLTETKRKGRGNEEIGNYIHLFSGVGKDARAKRGVSIVIRKDLRKNIRSWEEVDEQIMTLEINKNGHKIVIVGVYAPSDDASREVKDNFYSSLSEVVADIKDDKEIYILGDLNGRVGKEEHHPVVGRYGESAKNDNGIRLRDLCQNMSLKIMNGFFPHREVHKFTWIQPTRSLRSIIDYVIQRQNFKLKTIDVRVYRGSECGSDHHLLMAKVIVNYRKTATHKAIINHNKNDMVEKRLYNLESLKQESVKFLYKLRLANKLHMAQKVNRSVEGLYQHIKGCIHEAAKEALGYKEKRDKQNPEWWTEKLNGLVEKKKLTYHHWLHTRNPEDQRAYAILNREVKKEVLKSKDKMWERKCEEVDRCIGGTKVAEAWKTLKNLRKESSAQSSISLISITEWENHYKELLTEHRIEFEAEEIDTQTFMSTQVEEITTAEIKKGLKESKNGKAAGPGDIPIELMKYGPDVLHEIMAEIFNRCMLNGESVPEEWNLAYISSIYKKGDKRSCKNYRGISITSAMGRLYGRILKKRIESEYQDIEEQNGFRAGRSCVDNSFVLQQVIEKRKARNLPTHLTFVDLEKAYDTVPLKKLFKTLTKIGLSGIYVRAIMNCYELL